MVRIFVITLALLFAGCNHKPVVKVNPTAAQLYARGMQAIEGQNPAGAISYFEQIEQEFPHSNWLEQAKVMQIFAYFTLSDYDTTVAQAQNFISLHPVSSNLSYVYYLQALSHYNRILMVTNDQTATKEAQVALSNLIKLFPTSLYAKDAKIKLDLVEDHLAGQEMAIGRFYLKQGNLPAAAGRFQHVIDNYATTPQAAESLYRMVEVMTNLQLAADAQRYLQILEYNYPKKRWTKRAAAIMAGES